MPKTIKFYDHQLETIELRERSEIVLDLSEPGTGKTLAHAQHFLEHRSKGGGAGLIACPLSLVGSVWPVDMAKLDRGIDVSCAYAANRAEAFKPGHDLYVTNYEGLKYVEANWKKLKKELGIDWLLIDEGTAMKNKEAQRTKAATKIARDIEYKAILSGTLGSKSILDYWAPMNILDRGKRLGSVYSGYRSAVCVPVQVGPSSSMIEWVPRDGAFDAVAALVADISIRHELEACHDMPGIVMHNLQISLPKKLQKLYDQMAREQAIILAKGKIITAVNGGVAANKLLQIASGSIYDNDKHGEILDLQRAEIIADLCEEREHSIIAFLWHHQRDMIIHALVKRGRRVAYIDGTVSASKRNKIVEDYQAGVYDDILLHPQAAAHGLTLTRATTTIWASPTYNYEWFDQLNRRAYRIGQLNRCEVIVITARNTLDEHAYAVCTEDGVNMRDMFNAIANYR
jgi:SNF2 family DNA or RNA helicase